MSGDDPFESPKLLIEGARHDKTNFDAESRAFLDGCFGVPVVQRDPKTDEQVLKYRVAQKIPGRLRVLASHVVNDLRHSLDQAVNCAAIELGGTKRNNYFPFAKDETEIDRLIRDNCRTVPATLKPTLKAFKPYGGGDDLLHSLNQIAGPNKHRLVLKLDLGLPHLILNDVLAQITGPAYGGFIGWDSAKQEVEVARVPRLPPGGNVKYASQAKFPLAISLGDSKTASGQPAATYLDALVSKVEGIVLALEAETDRLLRASHESPAD